MATTAARRTKLSHEVELDDCHWIATDGSILVPAQRAMVITIGIRLKSQSKDWSNNWRAGYGRSTALRKRTAGALALLPLAGVLTHLRAPARLLSFTRLAPRKLDSDNLVSVFKPIRDQVCCWLSGNNTPNARADDGTRSGYVFEYYQQQQRVYGVRVELQP
jgi:hypothetical protein